MVFFDQFHNEQYQSALRVSMLFMHALFLEIHRNEYSLNVSFKLS